MLGCGWLNANGQWYSLQSTPQVCKPLDSTHLLITQGNAICFVQMGHNWTCYSIHWSFTCWRPSWTHKWQQSWQSNCTVLSNCVMTHCLPGCACIVSGVWRLQYDLCKWGTIVLLHPHHALFQVQALLTYSTHVGRCTHNLSSSGLTSTHLCTLLWALGAEKLNFIRSYIQADRQTLSMIRGSCYCNKTCFQV